MLPYFKTNHKTSYPTNTFQNKNIKTTHFLPVISSFFLFPLFQYSPEEVVYNNEIKKYFSMYSWLFFTNPLPFNLFCLLIWEDKNYIKLTGWFEADKHLFLRPSKTSWRIWWSAGMGPFCTGSGGSGVWGCGGCGVACWRGCGVIGWYPWKTKTNFQLNCNFL